MSERSIFQNTCSMSLSMSTLLNMVSQNSGIPFGSSSGMASSFFASSIAAFSFTSSYGQCSRALIKIHCLNKRLKQTTLSFQVSHTRHRFCVHKEIRYKQDLNTTSQSHSCHSLLVLVISHSPVVSWWTRNRLPTYVCFGLLNWKGGRCWKQFFSCASCTYSFIRYGEKSFVL